MRWIFYIALIKYFFKDVSCLIYSYWTMHTLTNALKWLNTVFWLIFRRVLSFEWIWNTMLWLRVCLIPLSHQRPRIRKKCGEKNWTKSLANSTLILILININHSGSFSTLALNPSGTLLHNKCLLNDLGFFPIINFYHNNLFYIQRSSYLQIRSNWPYKKSHVKKESYIMLVKNEKRTVFQRLIITVFGMIELEPNGAVSFLFNCIQNCFTFGVITSL